MNNSFSDKRGLHKATQRPTPLPNPALSDVQLLQWWRRVYDRSARLRSLWIDDFQLALVAPGGVHDWLLLNAAIMRTVRDATKRWVPMRFQCFISSTAALLILGCDPGIVVEGNVTDRAGKPIPNAKISVNCEGTDEAFTGNSHSDNDGNFTLSLGLGCLPEECRVSVSKDGKSKDFNVGEHCQTAVAQCDNGCNVVQIDARF